MSALNVKHAKKQSKMADFSRKMALLNMVVAKVCRRSDADMLSNTAGWGAPREIAERSEKE